MASLDWTSAITQYLKLGADATAQRGGVIESISAGVQSAIEQYIGRHLDVQTHTESYNGDGKCRLFLRWAPVVSVSSLTINGSACTVGNPLVPTYPPAEVIIENGECLVTTTGLGFTCGFSNVIVTYRAGYSVCPDDIRQAGVSWAAVIFKDRDRAGLASENVGGQMTSFVRDMPPFVKLALDGHRRWSRPC